MNPQPVAMPAEYKPLYKYLKDRYADTVCLTLAQIEDLMGVRLPDEARVDPAWWANPGVGHAPSAQAQGWIQANRTATANVRAKTVTFVRGLE